MAGEIFFKSGSKSSITTQTPLTPSYKAGTVYFAVDSNNNGFIYFDYDNKRIPMTSIAEKATYDGGGNEIESTYIKSLNYSGNSTTNAAGTTITAGSAGLVTLIKGDDTTSKIDIPAATASIAGLVNNGAQTFAGTKTFSTGLTISSGTSTKAVFNYSDIQAGTSNSARPVWFAWAGQNGTPVIDTNFTYNPSGGVLKATTFDGLATKATNDSNNHQITDWYVHSITSANNVLTYSDGDGDTMGTTNIINSVSNTWAAGTTAGPTIKTTVNGVAGTAVAIPVASASASGVVTTGAQTFAGVKTFSSKIKGNLEGNADTATKATQDGGGNIIEDTYISDITHTSSTTEDYLHVTYGSGTQANKFQLTTITIRTWEATSQ